MKEKLYIFDTTLRDGAQTYGVDFNVDEKKLLAKKLDELGVDYIEGGWPGANSTDTKFFNQDLKFKNSMFTAFGMTKKSGRSAENDPGLAAMINIKAPSACVVGKSWDFHVDLALGITNEENLNINTAQVELLIAQRNEARSNKNFDDADRIRDELDKMGVILEDQGGETTWKVK